ncbi:MAG: HEXXH motif-containing putative peptide modification protein [Alphaproteobacteria bacterium]|nr:HEXXH motif-containing putative peptide modification protein [Alphaproteobacteria bacterium]
MVAAKGGSAFLPCKEAAIEQNASMCRALCASLLYVADTVKHAPYSPERRSAIESRVSIGDLAPEVFGLYYEACFKMLDGDVDGAGDIIDEIACMPFYGAEELQVHALDHPDIAHMRELFLSRLDLRGEFALSAPTANSVEVERRLTDALSVLRRSLPDLYGEMSVLIRRIILVGSSPIGKAFDGAAVYQLWRLLFLNENRLTDRLSLIETLVHEEAHIFLFGHTIETALTLNGSNERHYSAIRDEKRPIDGIFHAMIVNARIVWAFSLMRKRDDIFTPTELGRMAQIIRRHEFMYAQHKSVIHNHARLSEIGRRIFSDADAYMLSVPAGGRHARA